MELYPAVVEHTHSGFRISASDTITYRSANQAPILANIFQRTASLKFPELYQKIKGPRLQRADTKPHHASQNAHMPWKMHAIN